MAKKSIIERERKRERLYEKYMSRRQKLKAIIKSSQNVDEIMEAQDKLAKLPVNSSPVRQTSRCNQCGRAHAVYQKFGLCRICLRQQTVSGNVPGVRKASW